MFFKFKVGSSTLRQNFHELIDHDPDVAFVTL